MHTLCIDLLVVFALTLSTIVSVQLQCYSNADLIEYGTSLLYQSLSLTSCRCLAVQLNMSAFQYDKSEQICHILSYKPPTSNLRVAIDSQVCVICPTPMSSSNATVDPPQPPPSPLTATTSVSNSNYYVAETLSIENTAVLTSLTVEITVPRAVGMSNPRSYMNFASDTMSTTIVQATDSFKYTCQLTSGKSVLIGRWQFVVQFDLNGWSRSSSNDTFVVRIQDFQPVYGHF